MPFKLSDVDTDGAIRETATALEGSVLDGDTRGSFLRKAGITGGAAITGGAFMAMLPELASAAPSKKQDIQILNFALTLEYLEAAFYDEAVKSGALSGQVLELARKLNIDEQVHVRALKTTIKSLKGTPVKEPKFNFRGTTKDQAKFVETSFVLENTGVRAYLGQAGRILNPKILAAAASIVTVEARHAGAIAVLLNQNPFGTTRAGRRKSISPSGSFDKPARMSTILSEVKATKFIVG